MDFVAIDLGASTTRYTSSMSVDKDSVHFMPNNMVIMHDELEKEFDNENLGMQESTNLLDNLDVTIKRTGAKASDIFPMRVFVGNMGTRIGRVPVTPDALQLKFKQPVNYASTILCVAAAYAEAEDEGVEHGSNIDLFITLPPAEIAHKEDLSAELKGTYTIRFNRMPDKNGKDGREIKFTIANVDVRAESQMALMYYMFSNKEMKEKLKVGNVISLDIGHSTTDLALFKEGKYMEKSSRTFPIGCKIAHSHIKAELRSQMNLDVSDEQVEATIMEGRVPVGNHFKNAEEIVKEGKRKVAEVLVQEIKSYPPMVGLKLSDINYIVVSGGGSMSSSYVDDKEETKITTDPMSKLILEEISKICDTIDVLYMEDEPRLANIHGLHMYANAVKNRKEAEANK